MSGSPIEFYSDLTTGADPRFEIEAVLDTIADRRCDSEHMIGGPDRAALPAHPYRPIGCPRRRSFVMPAQDR
jgi:hypothetical protein